MPEPIATRVRAAILAAHARSTAFSMAWQGGEERRRLAERFAHAEDAEQAAADLLADLGWLEAWLAEPVKRLREDPFFAPPFRHSRDGLRTGMVLFEGPVASITATILSADAAARAVAPPGVVAPGRLSLTRYVRAGGAVVERWQVGRPANPFIAAQAAPARPLPPLRPEDGGVLRHDGREEAHRLAGMTRDVVMVTVTLRPGAVPLMREYARDDGRLLRAAALDDRPSRATMLLRLLREQGRHDAGACFEAASRDPAFFLRWEAMREWLALDVAAALPRLREMAAADPHPEIRDASTAMLDVAEQRLAEQRLEPQPCRA